MRIFHKKWHLELLHYVLVFAVIALTWIPLMQFWQSNVWLTALSSLIVFTIADKIAHAVLKFD